MARNLTDRYIANLKPTNKRQHIFDSQVPGLCVRVSPAGKKTFTVVVRDRHGKQIWREVNGRGNGRYGILSLEEARSAASAGIKRIKRGEEPFPKPEYKPEPESYVAVAAEFVEKHAKPRQRTWTETERILKSLPWGDRPFASISKTDAYKLLDGFVADGNGPKAKVTLAWLKTLWRWAWKRDYVETPLMDAVEINFERRVRDRVYSEEEIGTLWNATEGLTAQERAFVKLVALLGVRKNELAKMRRDELDDPDNPKLWTIPYSRTKSKKTAKRERVYMIPLPPLSRRVLKPLLKGKGEDDLVFPGRHAGKAIDPGTSLFRKVRKASGIEDWYPHAHRNTIATWMENEGASEYERGLILNHAGSGSVTADYSHGYPIDLKRKWLERWSRHVAEIVQPEGAELLA